MDSPNANATTAKHFKTESAWLKVLPELLSVMVVLAFVFVPLAQVWIRFDTLFLLAVVEGGLMMANATLIDIASRLKKPPPWWLGVIILIGVLVMSPGGIATFQVMWLGGLWFILPTLWGIFERLREMWTMPNASDLEKIRRRTLVFDRLYTGLVLAGCAVAYGIINAIQNDGSMSQDIQFKVLPWLLLGLYSISAYNAWRVHQEKFTQQKKSLFPFIDQDQNKYLAGL